MTSLNHTKNFFNLAVEICREIDHAVIDQLAEELAALRMRNGRLFIIGVGGSAANCSHAVNDFRKICAIEAYAPTDNVAELTARTNDEGWETVFEAWLTTSRARSTDALMVFSVGGGNLDHNVSVNIVRAIDYAKQCEMKIFGVVGRDGGHAARRGDIVVRIPMVDAALVTPLAEAFQAVVWHCLVCHPTLMVQTNKWEGLSAAR